MFGAHALEFVFVQIYIVCPFTHVQCKYHHVLFRVCFFKF